MIGIDGIEEGGDAKGAKDGGPGRSEKVCVRAAFGFLFKNPLPSR